MSEEMADGSARTPEQRREALVEQVFGSAIGLMELLSIYVGERLGLYRALAEGGAATAPELAAATATNKRYAREWLEQQAVAGILEVEDERAGPEARRFRLPEGHDEVLLERDSLYYAAPLAQQMVSITRPLPAVLEAFKTGGGVPYPDYGDPLPPEGVLRQSYRALRRVRDGARCGGAADRGEASGRHQDDKPPLRAPALLRDEDAGHYSKGGASKACEPHPLSRRERGGTDPRGNSHTNPLHP